jgi:hypothetical protein
MDGADGSPGGGNGLRNVCTRGEAERSCLRFLLLNVWRRDWLRF